VTKTFDHGTALRFTGNPWPDRCLVVMFILVAWSGCTPKISPIEVPLEAPEEFSIQGEAAIPDKWWTAFGDPQLNALIDSALARNMDLISVWHQLQAARAMVRARSTLLLPDIEARAQTAISRPVPDFTGGETTQIGASASYEIDLWGRIKSSIQAEEFNLQASYYDYQTAALSISVVQTGGPVISTERPAAWKGAMVSRRLSIMALAPRSATSS